jgi:hypothetical protein
MRTICGWVVVSIVVVAGGCGPRTADVAGVVTFEGKPVGFGNVVLIASDGATRYGSIQQDGSYRVAKVPLGPAKVMVSSPPPPGAGPPQEKTAIDIEKAQMGGPPPPIDQNLVKLWFPIPSRYGNPDQSGLTVNVDGKPFDINLVK